MKLDPKFLFKNAGKIIQDSSPTILTGIGVAGVVGTAYLVGKASFKACFVLGDESVKPENNQGLTKKQMVEKVWKLYIPAVGVGSLTIAAIIASNRIHARRLAALAAGYALLSGDFDDYREKAAEMLGGKKSAELDQKRTAANVANNPPPTGALFDGKSWFLDKATKRYHATTTETLKAAQNEINFTILNHGDASLSDFYGQIGMDPTSLSDKVGWNREHKCELKVTPILTEDRGAVTEFEFVRGPVPNHWKSTKTDLDGDPHKLR